MLDLERRPWRVVNQLRVTRPQVLLAAWTSVAYPSAELRAVDIDDATAGEKLE